MANKREIIDLSDGEPQQAVRPPPPNIQPAPVAAKKKPRSTAEKVYVVIKRQPSKSRGERSWQDRMKVIGTYVNVEDAKAAVQKILDDSPSMFAPEFKAEHALKGIMVQGGSRWDEAMYLDIVETKLL